MKRIFSFFMAIIMVTVFFAFPVSAAYYRDDFPNTHRNTGKNLADLIAVAKTQIGYTELSTKTGAPLVAGQDGGYTKYGNWFGAPTTAWCAFFVAWCANQANISTNVIPRIGNCQAMVNWYKKNGVYFTSGSAKPAPGDLIFYNWNGGTTAKHIGIVTGVSGNSVYVVEGNTGSSHGYRAEAKTRKITSSYILGYARPAYNDAATYIGSYSFADYAATIYKTKCQGNGTTSQSAYSSSSKLSVVTCSAEDISAYCATLKGRIENNTTYPASSAGFYFGKSENSMKSYRFSSSSSKGTLELSMNISDRIGSLEPMTKYYFCSYAVVKGQTYKGPVFNFTTTDDKPEMLILSDENLVLEIDETYELFSALLPLDCRDDGLIWYSDDPIIAQVDDGIIKASATGYTTVTATSVYGDATASCNVLVTLAPVKNLQAQNLSENEIKLSWNKAESKQCAGYEIYRCNANSEEYKKIGTVKNNDNCFSDKQVTPGESYYYKIKCLGQDESFDSELCESVRASAALPKPKLTEIKQDGAKLTVSWLPVENAKCYNIYRSYTENGIYDLIGTTDRLQFTDTGLLFGNEYYYKVVAYSKRSHSVFSDSLSIFFNESQLICEPCITKNPFAPIIKNDNTKTNIKPKFDFIKG